MIVNNSILSATISAYWPIWLVFISGVILFVIAVLALLLISGQTDFSTALKKLPMLSIPKKTNTQKDLIEVQFFRIGRDSDARKESIAPNQWFSIGSDKKADFCLDTEDPKLAGFHFRMFINKSSLLLEAIDKETFVNGVPIRKLGTVQASSGDLVRAGSHEYRVILLPCEEKENVT